MCNSSYVENPLYVVHLGILCEDSLHQIVCMSKDTVVGFRISSLSDDDDPLMTHDSTGEGLTLSSCHEHRLECKDSIQLSCASLSLNQGLCCLYDPIRVQIRALTFQIAQLSLLLCDVLGASSTERPAPVPRHETLGALIIDRTVTILLHNHLNANTIQLVEKLRMPCENSEYVNSILVLISLKTLCANSHHNSLLRVLRSCCECHESDPL